MTFYERERNKQTRGMQEIPVGTTVQLEGSVVLGERVTRYAQVVGPDTLKVDHHLFGFPGIQPGGWPLTRKYTGEQANKARLWKQDATGSGDLPTRRIVWRP